MRKKKQDAFADAIARLFWTYNAVEKDVEGTVRVVGRTHGAQAPQIEDLFRDQPEYRKREKQ